MNEGTPLGVKGTISHKVSVPYTTPNCGLYLYLFMPGIFSYLLVLIPSTIISEHKFIMLVYYLGLNLPCRGLLMPCSGDRLGGDKGDVSPSSGMFSSSSLMDGRVRDGTPFISDSCCSTKCMRYDVWCRLTLKAVM
jgi:hypothetical protein